MKKAMIMFAALLACSSAFADHLDLDKLLRDIQQTQGAAGKIDADQEARFLAAADQAQALEAARAELRQQEQLSQQLSARLNAGKAQLSQLAGELDNRSGTLTDLFDVARQVAGDLKADLNASLISAEFPDRSRQLAAIADAKALPTIDQLERLWFSLQQEMTESGKVVYYDQEVLSAAGEPRQAKVIRIGAFNALADGKYLRYLPETGKLADLPRQPESEFTDLAEAISAAQTGPVAIGIDPTRGAILGMLIQTPDTLERLAQGGAIGYIIMALGVIGFLYGVVRLVVLTRIGQKMTRQMNRPEISEDNPLGRVLAVAEHSAAQETDNLELLLDEAITREVPALERGIAMIKLLAAVAPLLGLLGTITGMILTFQSISLFGTGDPKLMAGGISQALVTTMQGLCVAIPLLFLHSLVVARSHILIQILDEQTAGLISRRAGQ
ncbi:MotA/TolQ/ExbB proton channel family protein [Methylobacter marinus]|jgi:biopolymer transport protein ExbB|uniref:MotA/TolQ/ExbB proton channel family protein n=1 Tax=Methylobacter marinus TaxID=34058 RepID=UPI00036140C5|nr:MotA/TolQ/ExbB proton channel family protein [Methylobacter marinus]